MEPRRIDALIAEHLEGWRWLIDLSTKVRVLVPGCIEWVDGHTGDGTDDVPDYSSTWEGMGLVVEAMRGKRWSLRLDVHWVDEHGFGRCFAEFRSVDPGRYGPASADTPERAVGLAALAALGVSVEGD